MKKKLKLTLLSIVAILSFSVVKVSAATKLVCMYDNYEYTYVQPVTGKLLKEKSDAFMIVQDASGNIKIYKNSTAEINEGWKEIADSDNLTYKKVYDTEMYVNKQLTACPSKMTFSATTISKNQVAGRGSNDYETIATITFNDETPSNIVESKIGYSYKELFDEYLEDNQITDAELTCWYVGSWFESAVRISQTQDGKITVARRRKQDWADSNEKLDFEGTQLKEEHGDSYILTGCPEYVTFKPFVSGTIYLNDKTTMWNDNIKVTGMDDNWFDLKDQFESGILIDPIIPDSKSFTCNFLLGSPTDRNAPAYYLSVAFNVIKYVAIILLIVLSVIDFISAIASQDNEILNKTVRKTITRVILCAVIFILPFIINFALKILNDYQENVGLCGIGTTSDLGGGR